MLALIQRVSQARVEVGGEIVGQIERGLLALVGVQPEDGPKAIDKMAERLLAYRVFEDETGKMNRSLSDVGGGLLLVSQFTLAADTRSGLRPSFSSAAAPDLARQCFDALLAACRQRHPRVESGRFGAHMLVSLTNDGPVTFLLQS
ncbi:D-aminoacyl-tRNA deacylase [Pseudomarimonas arenosa]|uniref:D-aminoacyl-tRNA deacylase n=1 Tax=Pseudomarimonas arenosa TaxID=2774145 RepID=A0AAW3ZQV4_9GAMM|nr:D-aminoacyl-tRNA deacylase [Pseudomarimonas arenosa]MBD8527484.1 D-tyrosyl-tRNA(Tyr) deacylase [Pseudomarimonas arenosa]